MGLYKLNLDLSKIDKDKIYIGKKGKYYEVVVRIKDEEDQFGNVGFVRTSTTKEERDAGYEASYLGNLKKIEFTKAAAAPAKADEVEEDLPF